MGNIKDEDVEKLCKSSGMNPEQVKIYSPVFLYNQSLKVKKSFEEFVEKYPDGKMNKDQFEDYMIKVKQSDL